MLYSNHYLIHSLHEGLYDEQALGRHVHLAMLAQLSHSSRNQGMIALTLLQY